MTQTMHGHHIDNSGVYDDDPNAKITHCGGRRSCAQCLEEMTAWDLFSVNCSFCNTHRKSLIASVCPNCHRDWADRF